MQKKKVQLKLKLLYDVKGELFHPINYKDYFLWYISSEVGETNRT